MEQITRAPVEVEARWRAIARVGVDLAKRVIEVHAVVRPAAGKLD